MNKTTIGMGCAAVAAITIIAVLVVGSFWVSTYNRQQRLLAQYEAKVDANRAELSNLKSKLPEAAQVTDAQMEKLGELFTNYAEARSPDGGGALMQWVTEAVPNVDQATFLNLQNMIAATRDSWTKRQTELVDITREYNTNLATQPKGAILAFHGFERLVPVVIVTSDTNRAFETGVDEKIDLFPREVTQ